MEINYSQIFQAFSPILGSVFEKNPWKYLSLSKRWYFYVSTKKHGIFLVALSMYQKPIYIITFMTANIPAHFVHHLGPTFHLRMYVLVEM